MEPTMKRTWIDRVIEPGAITALFQPIVDIREQLPTIFAVEGLSRGPRGTTLEPPDILFEFARRKHEEPIVDRAAVAAILHDAARLPETLPVQINVHASTIGRDEGFVSFLRGVCRGYAVHPSRLTLEILEHSNYVEESRYMAAIQALRAEGVGIALDDIGVGWSNFRMILVTRPSQLKVDRCLVDGIAEDAFRQTTMRAIRLLADQAGAKVVAEGVEREADLEQLRRLGVEYAQGYLFSRPLSVEDLLSEASPIASPARPTWAPLAEDSDLLVANEARMAW
jgi:EAL domain-containing protein (putative c-di-GMP-specific phosphodiesterase class I)